MAIASSNASMMEKLPVKLKREILNSFTYDNLKALFNTSHSYLHLYNECRGPLLTSANPHQLGANVNDINLDLPWQRPSSKLRNHQKTHPAPTALRF